MDPDHDKANDTIQSIKECRTQFRLKSSQMLMDMCNDIGDIIQTYSTIDAKSKLKLVESRKALLSKVEDVHENEQKDAEIVKKLIRKNKAYRKIRFNESELEMLEEVVQIKNDSNKLIQNEKKKKTMKKKKSFISRAGKEQNMKNYKEFVKSKQEQFTKNKSKMIAQYKQNKRRSSTSSSTRCSLPPITPRELGNLPDFKKEEARLFGNNKAKDVNHAQETQSIQKHNDKNNIDNNTSKKSLRRFQLNGAMSLNSQMKELRKLKKIKLDDLTNSKMDNSSKNYEELDFYPGRL